MNIGEIVRDDYDVISVNETISKVIPMLSESKHERAILVEENGKIVGIVREKDLIRGGLMTTPRETKIKKFFTKTGIIHISELTPERVARRFVEDSVPFVLVKLNRKIGVIYINDFLQKIKQEFENVEVGDVMNPEVIVVRSSDSAAKALATMRDYGVSRVVVVDDENKVVGIITGKDIIDRVVSLGKDDRLGHLSMKEKIKTLSIIVEGIMSYPVVTIKKENPIAKAIDLMVENDISSLVVVDGNVPGGIITKKDFLEYYLKKVTPKEYEVQIITKGVVLDDSETEVLLKDLNKFLKKFKGYLGKSHLFVYMKKLKLYYRRIPLIYVRMKLTSDRGTFFVTGESWGIEFAIHVTLNKLERQVIKDKELVVNKRTMQRFYEETL